MAETKIEWTDWTLNPVKGKCPVACSYCYARKTYDRFRWNPEIRFVPGVFDTLPEKPVRVFVGSTIELLLFDDWMEFILNRCQDFPQHTFQFLTKKPEKLPQWSPFPDNCWPGVTATNMRMLADACYILKRVEAKVKYISLEPLLDFTPTEDLLAWNMSTAFIEAGINQVIIGACTGKKSDLIELNKRYPDLILMPYGHQWTLQPQIEAIEMIVREADQAGAKVFLKDNLEPLITRKASLKISGCYSESFITGEAWKLRQEIPG